MPKIVCDPLYVITSYTTTDKANKRGTHLKTPTNTTKNNVKRELCFLMLYTIYMFMQHLFQTSRNEETGFCDGNDDDAFSTFFIATKIL